MRIPGVPGGSEPSFRTRDCRWMGLDLLVMETHGIVVEGGWDLSLHVVKATVQVARWVVQEPVERETEELIQQVVERLRERGVILQNEHVSEILTAYAQVVAMLDILEINELGV